MNVGVAQNSLSEGVGGKHSGQQKSNLNHSPPQKSLVLQSVSTTEMSRVEEKFPLTNQKPRDLLIPDHPSQPGVTLSFTPASTV